MQDKKVVDVENDTKKFDNMHINKKNGVVWTIYKI